MTDDDYTRKLLKQNRYLFPELDRARSLADQYASSAITQHLEEAQRINQVTDLFKDRHRLMELSGLSRHLGFEGLLRQDLQLARSLYEQNFSLPAIEEARRIIDSLDYGSVVSQLNQMEDRFSVIQSALESMRSPWLDDINQMRSARGITELIGIGHALNDIPSFDEMLGRSLRDNLGDWRDTITWSDAIFTDPAVRIDFYVERGFDEALTDFPSDTFDEGLAVSGLNEDPPLLVDIYGSPIPPSSNPEEEHTYRRTNVAHDWLFRLESQIRHLIQVLMTARYGPDWPKHKLPNRMFDEWNEKRRADGDRGTKLPLIAYADFSDYVRIISKRDLWNEVFAPVFGRQEDVRESFQRLHPIRICTMHARAISHDDELLLYVESKRLYAATRKHVT